MLQIYARTARLFAAITTLLVLLAIGPSAVAQQVPSVSGLAPLLQGILVKHYDSAANNNSTLVVANSATLVHGLFGINAVNTNATTAYLKFYDKATAPTCGTDTPFAVFQLAQNVAVTKGFVFPHPVTLGLGFCIVANVVSTDNTSATTGISLDVAYK